MLHPFTRRFSVRHHELDFFNHVNNAVYVDYVHETLHAALLESDCLPPKTIWRLHHLAIRYFNQARYGDELEFELWLSARDARQLTVELQAERFADHTPVLRARAVVGFAAQTSGTPLPVPTVDRLPRVPGQQALGIRLLRARDTGDSHRYVHYRRVQIHELDSSRHVAPSHYFRWVVQAFFDAIREAGHPIEGITAESGNRIVVQGGHECDFFAPIPDNTEIKMVSWICQMARVRGAWTHELYDATTGALLARDYSLGLFVDAAGKLSPLPQHLIDDVLRGPR